MYEIFEFTTHAFEFNKTQTSWCYIFYTKILLFTANIRESAPAQAQVSREPSTLSEEAILPDRNQTGKL